MQRLTAKKSAPSAKKASSELHIPIAFLYFTCSLTVTSSINSRVISHSQRSSFSPFYYTACDWSMPLIIRYSASYKRRCAIKVFLVRTSGGSGCVCNFFFWGKKLEWVKKSASDESISYDDFFSLITALMNEFFSPPHWGWAGCARELAIAFSLTY